VEDLSINDVIDQYLSQFKSQNKVEFINKVLAEMDKERSKIENLKTQMEIMKRWLEDAEQKLSVLKEIADVSDRGDHVAIDFVAERDDKGGGWFVTVFAENGEKVVIPGRLVDKMTKLWKELSQ
jgi:nuclear transport factor 2 (NTF2) superfamily protein